MVSSSRSFRWSGQGPVFSMDTGARPARREQPHRRLEDALEGSVPEVRELVVAHAELVVRPARGLVAAEVGHRGRQHEPEAPAGPQQRRRPGGRTPPAGCGSRGTQGSSRRRSPADRRRAAARPSRRTRPRAGSRRSRRSRRDPRRTPRGAQSPSGRARAARAAPRARGRPRGASLGPASRALPHTPRDGGDLIAGEADERVAVAERVVHERERALAGEGDEPQREPSEVHGERVAIHAVEAALGDEPPRMEERDLPRRQRRRAPVRSQAATRRSASCRHASTRKAPEPIAGSQILSARISSGDMPSRQQRGERPLHHEPRDRPRGVVGARAPAALAGLDVERSCLDLEPHEPLVHRPHVLDVELRVPQTLAAWHEEPIEHPEHAAVRDRGAKSGPASGRRLPARGPPGTGTCPDRRGSRPPSRRRRRARRPGPCAVPVVDRLPWPGRRGDRRGGGPASTGRLGRTRGPRPCSSAKRTKIIAGSPTRGRVRSSPRVRGAAVLRASGRRPGNRRGARGGPRTPARAGPSTRRSGRPRACARRRASAKRIAERTGGAQGEVDRATLWPRHEPRPLQAPRGLLPPPPRGPAHPRGRLLRRHLRRGRLGRVQAHRRSPRLALPAEEPIRTPRAATPTTTASTRGWPSSPASRPSSSSSRASASGRSATSTTRRSCASSRPGARRWRGSSRGAPACAATASRWTEFHTVVVGLTNRRQLPLTVRTEDEAQEAVRLMAVEAPRAARGYTPELEASFLRDPASVLSTRPSPPTVPGLPVAPAVPVRMVAAPGCPFTRIDTGVRYLGLALEPGCRRLPRASRSRRRGRAAARGSPTPSIRGSACACSTSPASSPSACARS